MKQVFAGLGLVVVLVPVVVACAEPDPPGAGNGAEAPAAQTDAGAAASREGGAAAADSKAAPATAADAGGAGTTTAGADCKGSFARDVLPALDAAGCASFGCHGTRFSPAIRIELEDPALTYDQLRMFAIDGKPYVKVGAALPAESAIHCHLAGTCGRKMPPAGGEVPPAAIAKVDKWLSCGAPKD